MPTWQQSEVAGRTGNRLSPPLLQDILAKLDELELNGGAAPLPPQNGLSALAAAAPDLLGFGEEEEPREEPSGIAAGAAAAAYAAEEAFGDGGHGDDPAPDAEPFAEQEFQPEAEADTYPSGGVAAEVEEDDGDVFADAAPPPQQAAAPPPPLAAAVGDGGLTPEEEALLEGDDDLMGDDLGVDEADLEDGGEGLPCLPCCDVPPGPASVAVANPGGGSSMGAMHQRLLASCAFSPSVRLTLPPLIASPPPSPQM